MMATTKIWPVRGWLGQVVIYVEEPAKTERPLYVEKQGITDAGTQGLEDVIEYAMAQNKTVLGEDEETMQYFVSGINCTPSDARHQMMKTKRDFDKEGGVVGLHGYQSFKPGEVTPEVAHEIGLKLAGRLWGDRYQVIVATHIDRGHIHNHVVINTVSWVDGEKLRATLPLYQRMRDVSDELCLEYGLSVIENPQPGKAKHYAEWQAERADQPTWREIIRKDVDEAIDRAMTDRQFFDNLKALGYEVKQGKDISVRPPGKERFLRLARNFGDDYTIDGIRARILEHRQVRIPLPKHKQANWSELKKMPAFPKGSIWALYKHYLYLFGFNERGSPGGNERMHFLLREDLRKLDELIADEKLLGREKIETDEQLLAFKGKLGTGITALSAERTELRRSIRADAQGESYSTKDDSRYQQINKQLKTLREEVRQCVRIAERSGVLEERIGRIERDEYQDDRKEGERSDGRIGAGGRADRQDDTARH